MTRSLKLCFFAALTIAAPSACSIAQTVIRDTVHLVRPMNSATHVQSATTTPNGFYLRKGGMMRIEVSHPYEFMGDTAFWEMHLNGRTIVKHGIILRDNQPFPDTGLVVIGLGAQWSYNELSISDPPPDIDYYPDENSSAIIGDEFPGLLFYRVLEETPDWRYNFAISVTVVPDSSLEAFPPEHIFDLIQAPWNPYKRDPYNPAMYVSIPGTYRLVIASSHAGGRDDIVMLQPGDSTLMESAQSRVGDTLILGTFAEGDAIELGLLNQSSPLLAGQTLYGGIIQLSPTVWEETFEDWTDLDFDDLTVRVELAVGPADHLELWSASSTIWYGDTVDVQITPADASGEFSPVGNDAEYIYSIEFPDTLRKYGQLIYRGEPGYVFDNIPVVNGVSTQLQFAANGEEPDSVVDLAFHLKAIYQGGIIIVSVRDEEGEGVISKKQTMSSMRKSGSANVRLAEKNTTEAVSPSVRNVRGPATTLNDPPTTGQVVLENDWILTDKISQIMLGETRYYGAKFKETQSGKELEIVEATMNKKGVPELEGAEGNVTWTVANDATSDAGTDTLRVYYEHKFPSWQPNERWKFTFDKMSDLTPGLIRLIGRYWREGKVFRVKLTADCSSGENKYRARYIIEIKKPARLGGDRHVATDVLAGGDFNVDDAIIQYAGDTGIPPQVMKGQMGHEAAKNEERFYPTYRYEPWEDLRVQSVPWRLRVFKEHPFFIDDNNHTTMGTGVGVPSTAEHHNVQWYPYCQTAVRVGEFLTQNAAFWDEWTTFKNGALVFNTGDGPNATELTMYWKDIKNLWFMKHEGLDEQHAITAATQYIKDKIVEHYQQWAQTRLQSSYGLVQVIYMTAVMPIGGYNKNRSLTKKNPTPAIQFDRPEDLQVFAVEMPVYRRITFAHLRSHLGSAEQWTNSWEEGYEGTWKDAIHDYNTRPDYDIQVLGLGESYQPVKE